MSGVNIVLDDDDVICGGHSMQLSDYCETQGASIKYVRRFWVFITPSYLPFPQISATFLTDL